MYGKLFEKELPWNTKEIVTTVFLECTRFVIIINLQ